MRNPNISPLYNADISHEIRRGIQAHNIAVILQGFGQYTFETGTRTIPLESLNINGQTSEDAELIIMQSGLHGRNILVTHDGRCITDQSLSAVNHEIETTPPTPLHYWKLSYAGIRTIKGFEGNGIATAITIGGELILSDWVDSLPHPDLVVAIRRDNAMGAEEKGFDDISYRRGWTSNIFRSLGYGNTPEALHPSIDISTTTLRYGDGKTWVKTLRDHTPSE